MFDGRRYVLLDALEVSEVVGVQRSFENLSNDGDEIVKTPDGRERLFGMSRSSRGDEDHGCFDGVDGKPFSPESMGE